jgi:hypothetical protein
MKLMAINLEEILRAIGP